MYGINVVTVGVNKRGNFKSAKRVYVSLYKKDPGIEKDCSSVKF